MPTDADFIRCRTYGHGWEDFIASDMPRPLFGFRLSLRCDRCTTIRHDLIDANGEVGSRHYNYPDGYKYARGDMPSRSDFRVLLLKQQRKERRAAKAKAS